MSTCHLNQIVADPRATPIYSVTRCNEEQHALLRALGMEVLADDEEVAENITPR